MSTTHLIDPDFLDLADLGWNSTLAEAFQHLAVPGLRPGRIARVDQGWSTVLVPYPVRARNQLQPVTAGDWVGLRPSQAEPDSFEVTAMLPRNTAFTRLQVGHTEAQVVAANLDVVLIAASLERGLNLRSLERYLVMGWESGATPLLVLTKADLRPQESVDDAVGEARTIALDAEVVAVSTVTGVGMDHLARRLLRPGMTSGVVGPSGAGKSTLVNWFIGRYEMATGSVRSDGKGRHTTSHRQLLVLPGRGILLDTPGLRSLGMWLSSDGVDRAFPDLAELASRCRFNDCSHTQEPGCHVLAAVSDGAISVARLDAWRTLEKEASSVEARQGDLAAQRAQRQKGKALAREQRRQPRA